MNITQMIIDFKNVITVLVTILDRIGVDPEGVQITKDDDSVETLQDIMERYNGD